MILAEQNLFNPHLRQMAKLQNRNGIQTGIFNLLETAQPHNMSIEVSSFVTALSTKNNVTYRKQPTANLYYVSRLTRCQVRRHQKTYRSSSPQVTMISVVEVYSILNVQMKRTGLPVIIYSPKNKNNQSKKTSILWSIHIDHG